MEWKHNTIGVSKNSRHFAVPLCVDVLMFSVWQFSKFEPIGIGKVIAFDGHG